MKIFLKGKKTNEHIQSTITKEKVIQVYNREKVSRQSPGKRDIIYVKVGSSGKAILVQKPHMQRTDGEAFAQENKIYSLKNQNFML